MSEIQNNMNTLGIKQVDMIFELRKRGLAIQPPEMSAILNGVLTTPKAKKVEKMCLEIIEEIKNENNG